MHDLPWTLDSLDWDRLDRSRVRHDEDLFFLLCSASFAQSSAAPAARALVEHFAGDHELRAWLVQHWEPEELQHGRALAAYVRTVWPEFDWEASYRAFCHDRAATGAAAPLESSRGLELAARCVVETGTAGLYRALHEWSGEPLLRELTGHIKRDKISHFKQFYAHYRRYHAQQGIGRYPVLRAVLRRVGALRLEDGDQAWRHVFNRCYPQYAADDQVFRRLVDRARGRLRRHIPARMTIKMLLAPLELPPRLQVLVERPLAPLSPRLLH